MSFIGIAGAVVGLGEEVLGGNPNDAARFKSADSLRDTAINLGRANEAGFAAYAKLRCLSGIGRLEDQSWLVAHPSYQGPGDGCVGGGWATDAARKYGAAQVAAVEAAWKVQGAKGTLSAPVDAAPPVVGTAGVVGQSEVPLWLIGVGVLVVAFLVIRSS